MLTLPLSQERHELALLAFLGGFSSATSMVIVATIAVSTMLSNHVVMPIALRVLAAGRAVSGDVRSLLLVSRRVCIAVILGLGFLYFRLSGGSDALAAIGLIAFVGVAQFLPSLLGGIFWRGGTRTGALSGLLIGFALWAYTLFLPSFGGDVILSDAVLREGPGGIGALRPQGLLGLTGLDPLVHAVVWSVGMNALAVRRGVQPHAARRAGAAAGHPVRGRLPRRGRGAHQRRGRSGRLGGSVPPGPAHPRRGVRPRAVRRDGDRAGPGRGAAAPDRRGHRPARARALRLDRGRLGARAGQPDRGSAVARHDRAHRHRGRDPAGAGDREPARGEVGGARAHRGAAPRRQRAAPRPRCAEGRVPRPAQSRAAHPDDLHPVVLRDPHGRGGRDGRGAPAVRLHHQRGEPAPDPPARRAARHQPAGGRARWNSSSRRSRSPRRSARRSTRSRA